MDIKKKKDFLSVILGDPAGTGIDGRYYADLFLMDCLEKADIFHILAAKDIAEGKYPQSDQLIKSIKELKEQIKKLEVAYRVPVI